MPSVINSTSTGIGGLISTGNVDNELILQTGDTTALSIDSSQNITAASEFSVSGNLDVSGDAAITGSFTFNNGTSPASTGKAIAMAIVFG